MTAVAARLITVWALTLALRDARRARMWRARVVEVRMLVAAIESGELRALVGATSPAQPTGVLTWTPFPARGQNKGPA